MNKMIISLFIGGTVVISGCSKINSEPNGKSSELIPEN